MSASFDPAKVTALLRECAQKIILPYHGKLEDHHKSFKQGDPNNEVTIADKESEAFLTKELKKLLPNSYVVGEEACEDDDSILDYLRDPTKTVWVIDPIDGTSNFARGSETFCVLIALVVDGKTEMGWIYDVCNDSIAFAQRGKGTFIDGKRVKLDPQASTDGKIGYTANRNIHKVGNIATTSLRCSGLEYFRIAKGESMFSVYGRMKPWDHLAGTLVVQEAGGIVRKWDHSAYDPGDRRGGLLTAANEKIWNKVRDQIPDKSLKAQGIEP